ncbi:ensconsin isoform X34 [Toxorhynchites rutilus septentrionalis]|uniref:ensconsin isoform X34 n=1 Tax=Toxorhynchites rutilus septentrionalis TaxID=329112 RepID=UPI00247AD1E7|nr:ensconsin isoform X34 [Toxorhynchites rutilus septentrionalis]
MISVKRCPATSLSASHNHHHNHHQNQQHSHHNPHSHSHRIPPVQIRSSSAGRAASNSCNSGSNSKRFGRSRNNSLYVNGTGITGYCSSGESTGGGDSGNSYSIITNGGSLYYNGSSSHHSVLGVKTRAGGDIFEFDSLFLVPKCALTYDKAMSLRKDLAAYDFNIRILEDTPKGNVWISGNRDASVQKQSRPASANKDHHPHSVNHTLHWFACVGEDSNGFSNEEELQKEREERIKQIKERQNEERQRKLEELKAQALAAQKFREQKEEERRRRMDDLRRRENDRRSQVEERRRAIQEADNERRQYILQKNQERDQRMETKRRNERSSIQFAFGSSTPRMIDTSDSGMCSSLWAHRRATSITNVAYTGAPLTRRSSERELTDGSSKKRATSASGLDRSTDDDSVDISYQRTVNRRKTDLMPTIPSPRDSSRSSLGTHTPRTPEKPPIPKASTANNSSSTSLERKRSQSGTSTPVKPALASDSARKHQAEKQRISSARGTPKASSTPLQSPGPEKANRTLHDTLQQQKQKQKQQPMSEEQLLQQQQQRQLLFKEDSLASVKSTEPEVSEQQYEPHEQDDGSMQSESVATTVVESLEQPLQKAAVENKPHEVSAEVSKPPKQQELEVSNHEEKRDEMKENTAAANNNTLEPNQQPDGSNGDLMTASMIAKRITTEEQAKAALAERRRLAREEAERQAELERQRIAAEEEAERQRQMEEEERLRMLELETNRLLEEQRRLEEERLQQAIQEAEKREEEERLRREEEARQKIEREEAERKAREEAERQRIEMDERLKKEEKEREERRKRVEAIMSRTRAKGSANNTPTKQSEENKDNAMSKSHIVTSNTPMAIVEPTMSMTESMLGGSLDLPQQAMQTITEGAPSQGEPSVTSVTEPVETLAQEIQSLSIVDQQQSQQNNNNDSSINNNHNSNDKSNSGSATSADSASFERSVTEKENLLLGSFNKNLNASNGGGSDNSSSTSNSSGSQQLLTLESSPATTNGKAASGGPTIAETTELIIEDAIKSGQTNGHKNGSIDNVFTQNPPVVDGTTKLLAHLTDNNSHVADFVALTSTVDVDGSENLLDVSSSTHATTTSTASSGPVVGQLIDFSSFQTLTTDEIQQQNAATIVNADPFNLNNNNTNSTSVNLVDSSSNGTSTTSFSTSLFSSANDANLISNSNFLNNNTTRLVATSDSQDNRDLSLL